MKILTLGQHEAVLSEHSFPLWAGMQKKEIDQLLEIVSVRSYENGELICTPADESQTLYLLQEGRIKTYVYSLQGDAKIMHIFAPGDAFGGLLMGSLENSLPYAEAVGDVVVCWLNEESFKLLMQRFPDICFGLFRYMADHHAADMHRIERLLHSKGIHKVVFTLLDLGERLDLGEQDCFSVTPHFTHEDIANMIGVKRTTVSELISELRNKGIVSGKGRQLLINRAAATGFIEQST